MTDRDPTRISAVLWTIVAVIMTWNAIYFFGAAIGWWKI